MRMSAKAEYATRAMAELAVRDPVGPPLKAEEIAAAQDIPAKFLLGILGELRAGNLVRSRRGPDGGYLLARPAETITLADVIRCIDGPLASVRDLSLSLMHYTGPAEPLTDVWMALRSSIRTVLEAVTLADLAGRRLPTHVAALAGQYRREELDRHPPAREV
ncbi:MAG TPA: Rrf2 family transcriptional regulator [Mycobacteriales bacterium]|nr:Rrf2 family transcriptional regulator [Mycobacteriales bacterium]